MSDIDTQIEEIKLITSTLMLDVKGVVNKYNNPEIAPKAMNVELDAAHHKSNQAIKTLLIQSKIEARIDENQRWANGYMEAFREYPELDNPEDLMAAKQDFEDRIKELSAQLKEELE